MGLIIVKSGNKLSGYISTVRDLDIGRGFVKETDDYTKRHHRLFVTDSFMPFNELKTVLCLRRVIERKVVICWLQRYWYY